MSEPIPFELSSLKELEKYQEWIFSKIRPLLGKRILEIGSGIGNMSRHFTNLELLILSEHDPYLFNVLRKENLPHDKNKKIEYLNFGLGTGPISPDLLNKELDTIISFNVLEHIQDDHLALSQMMSILEDNKSKHPKKIISFVPAHDFLYGTLDKEFGHFRRYTPSDIKRINKQAKVVEHGWSFEYFHFNFPGALGWWLNGKVFGKKNLSKNSLQIYNKLVPIFKIIDFVMLKLLKIPFGQSLCLVWEKQK